MSSSAARKRLPASSSESADAGSASDDASSSRDASSAYDSSAYDSSADASSARSSDTPPAPEPRDEEEEHASSDEERRLPFGELALLRELVTREQLESVLRAQGNRRDREDRAPKIATLLIREGIISKAEAKELLRLQREKGPIAGYELLEHLGSGGMGCVFRAREVASGREVAVKILPPRATQNSRFRARFLREAQVTQTLVHPNLVRSFAQGESEDHLWFAMELVPGITLRERIKRFGAAPEPEVRHVMRQLLAGLGHYWDDRIVHRDIKPENIMVTPDGVAKLTDLGLCRQLDDDAHLTRVGKTLGTPLYISPELARGRSDIDIRSDLYSLGATIYHLACGVPPFEAAAQADLLRAHVEQTPPAPRLKNPRLSEGLEAILLNLLAKQPDDRLATPRAALEALERLEQGKPPLPNQGKRTPRPYSVPAVPAPRRSGSTSAIRSAWGVLHNGSSANNPRATPRPRRGLGSPALALLAFVGLFAAGVLLGAHVRTASGATVARVDTDAGGGAADPERAFMDLTERAPIEAASEANRYVVSHPDDFAGQVVRLAAVIDRLPRDAPIRDDVERNLGRARERLEERAFEALEVLRASLIALVDAGRLHDAQARLASFPAVYRMTGAWEGYEELRREVERLQAPAD